jgi:predicted Zn-dependent protease
MEYDLPIPHADPLADLHDEGNGVVALRSARASYANGALDDALDHLTKAKQSGVPAEADPYWYALSGAVAFADSRTEEAIAMLREGWSKYPDVAALPALLGATMRRSGDDAGAATTLLAALAGDDPDHSLGHWRQTLGRMLSQ